MTMDNAIRRRSTTTVRSTILASVLLSGIAHATSPTAPVRIRGHYDPDGNIRLELTDDGVQEVTVLSVLTTRGTIIGNPTIDTVSVLSPRDVPIEQRSLLPDGYVVRGVGETVDLDVAHAISLAPGPYAEYLLVTVTSEYLEGPMESARFRYFQVTDDGTVPISSKEYSERTSTFDTLADGTRVMRLGGVQSSPTKEVHMAFPNQDSLKTTSTPGTSERDEP